LQIKNFIMVFKLKTLKSKKHNQTKI